MYLKKYLLWKWLFLPGIILCYATSQPVAAQNQAVSYVKLGSATSVNRFNYGLAGEVDLRLAPRIVVGAGFRLANQYPSGLGDLKAQVTVFPSKRSERWAVSQVVNYSNYAPYPMSQMYYLITGVWQSEHFRIDFGNAFAFLMGSGVVKTNLLRPSFSLKGFFRDRDKLWNGALFIRNFNSFEAHGARAVEWGGEISARIGKQWKVFCEPYLVTVGNFSGTANYYTFNCHIGGVFLW